MSDLKAARRSAPLPQGATGIEAGDFVIGFLRDKVVFLAKSSREHYTLNFGQTSGVLDLHRTWKDPQGRMRHETIFAMRLTDLTALLIELAPASVGMIKLLRRLRIGWLHRHNIGIVRGLEPTTDEQISAITTKHPRRKRLVVVEDKVQANVQTPEYLEDVWDFPDGAFALFAGSRRIGIGFKATRPVASDCFG